MSARTKKKRKPRNYDVYIPKRVQAIGMQKPPTEQELREAALEVAAQAAQKPRGPFEEIPPGIARALAENRPQPGPPPLPPATKVIYDKLELTNAIVLVGVTTQDVALNVARQLRQSFDRLAQWTVFYDIEDATWKLRVHVSLPSGATMKPIGPSDVISAPPASSAAAPR